MGLLGWIKSAIGIEKARPQEAAPQSQAPLEQDGLHRSHPAQRSESPPAPADHVQQVPREPARSESYKTVDDAEPALPSEVAVETAAEPHIAIAPEWPPAIEVEPERPPTSEEIDRRRAMVRAFFNDYWSSIEEKPASFAERLDHAEGYINERVAAGGEAWRLGPATRKQLGLPLSKNR